MTKPYEPLSLPPETQDFYRRILRALLDSGVPFLVGGAYAFARYTGIVRHTKDLDIFCREQDREHVLELLALGDAESAGVGQPAGA